MLLRFCDWHVPFSGNSMVAIVTADVPDVPAQDYQNIVEAYKSVSGHGHDTSGVEAAWKKGDLGGTLEQWCF